MSVKWIEHKGKRILYADFRGLKGEAAIETLDLLAKAVSESPTKVLLLNNVEGGSASPEWMARVKELGKEVFAARVEKTAAVGISGVKALLLEGYEKFTGRTVKAFKTEAQALEWLVKD